MTLRELVLSKKNAKAAIGILADNLERIKLDQAALARELELKGADWDWANDEPGEDDDHPDNDKVPIQLALEAAREELSTATDPDDQRALAARVELLEDEFKGGTVPPPEEGQRTNQIVSAEGDVIVEVPQVSAEKEHQRLLFADEMLKLGEAYPLQGDEFIASYGQAGPLLLYYTDRDFVMQQPDGIKRQMVEDVLETAPQEAHEFARDILKDGEAEGPSLA